MLKGIFAGTYGETVVRINLCKRIVGNDTALRSKTSLQSASYRVGVNTHCPRKRAPTHLQICCMDSPPSQRTTHHVIMPLHLSRGLDSNVVCLCSLNALFLQLVLRMRKIMKVKDCCDGRSWHCSLKRTAKVQKHVSNIGGSRD